MPDPKSAFQFGPPDNGRVYPIGISTRVVMGVGSAVAILVAIGLIWTSAAATDQPNLVFNLCIAFALVTTAVLIAFTALKSATVLYPDRIEARGPWRSRSISKIDIAGFRTIEGRNGTPQMKLTPKRSEIKPLTIYRFRPDAEFDRWFVGIPDLDAADLARSTKQLLADPALGSNIAERQSRLDQLKQVSRVFTGLTVVIGGWAWFWPKPFALVMVVAMLLPPAMLALVWWSKGGMAISGGKTEARPSAGAALFIGFVLFAGAFRIAVLDWTPALFIALPVAAIFAALALGLDPRLRKLPSVAIGVGLSALAYGWGGAVVMNSIADQSKPSAYQADVLEKWVHHGKATSWNIRLGPWGPQTGTTSMSIDSDDYDHIETGQTVCIGLHSGALGMRWYALQSCSGSGALTAHPTLPSTPPAQKMENFYPDRALRNGIGGRTQLSCIVGAGGILTDCTILSESPIGMGFGDATLRLAKQFRAPTATSDGQSMIGRPFVRTVVWRIPRS